MTSLELYTRAHARTKIRAMKWDTCVCYIVRGYWPRWLCAFGPDWYIDQFASKQAMQNMYSVRNTRVKCAVSLTTLARCLTQTFAAFVLHKHVVRVPIHQHSGIAKILFHDTNCIWCYIERIHDDDTLRYIMTSGRNRQYEVSKHTENARGGLIGRQVK